MSMDILTIKFILVSLTSFIFGVFVGGLLTREFRNYAYRHKLYNVDDNRNVKMFLMLIVSTIWFASNVVTITNGGEPNWGLNAIMGGVVGAYFGIDIFKKK